MSIVSEGAVIKYYMKRSQFKNKKSKIILIQHIQSNEANEDLFLILKNKEINIIEF